MINSLCKEAHELAKKKGWYEEERNIPELLALIHSEVSEALEEYRKSGITHINFVCDDFPKKPEGFPIEIADVLIRVFDLCGYLDIDIEEAIALKMKYNESRSYRHGNKHA